MKNLRSVVKNILLSAVVLTISFLVSLLFQRLSENLSLIPMVFVFAVFLISLLTQGYIYGLAAAVLSMMAVNYAFTFPYFKLNFTIPENLFSAIIMISVAVLTGTLTIRLRRQEALRAEGEKERIRANLLRAVSHDLRTPLTTIYGSSSALLEHADSFTPVQKDQMLRGIQEDAQWLVGMVENLLSITRIDSGRVKIIKTSTVLDELVDTVLVKFKSRYPGQHVELSLPEELVMIPMDPMLIQQVLINLLENAVLHARGMTTLSLRVYTQGRRAVFEVEDDGCGIDKTRLEDLFLGTGPSKDVPPDSQKRSAGIGLSVCATIIKAHGGTITGENRKGGGALFRFTLDREDLDHEQ